MLNSILQLLAIGMFAQTKRNSNETAVHNLDDETVKLSSPLQSVFVFPEYLNQRN